MPSPTYPSVDPYESASDSPSTSTDISPLPNHTNCEDNDYIEISDIEDPLLSDTAFYDLLAKAQTKLIKDSSLNHQHTLVGVKGTYSATKINGKPSHTTEWWHCKNPLEAKDFITNTSSMAHLCCLSIFSIGSSAKNLLKNLSNQKAMIQKSTLSHAGC